MTRNIYTITLSPAIDYILKFNNLEKGKTNRALQKDMYAAGKGIHVSMMLNNLGDKNEAIIFTYGDFENYFNNDLRKNKVNFKTFKANEEIRINLKLIDEQQTEGNITSPNIDLEEINKLKEYLETNVKAKDLVIIAGSSPHKLGEEIYAELAKIIKQKNAEFVVDAFGPLLTKTFVYEPFLIKPNLEELELTSQKKLTTSKEIIKEVNKILNQGVKNVLLSRGDQGAMLINKDSIYSVSIPTTDFKLVNAAGAGDSMLAAFVHSYFKNFNYEQALKLAVIAGSATVFSERIASKEMIDKIKQFSTTMKIEVQKNE